MDSPQRKTKGRNRNRNQRNKGNKSRKNPNMRPGGKQQNRPARIEPFSAGKPFFKAPGEGPYGANLIVTGVPDSMTVSQLKFAFERYGKLLKVSIPLDKFTRRPRGFAEINYESVEAAERAIIDLPMGIPLRNYRMYAEPLSKEELFAGIEVRNIPPDTPIEKVQEIFELFGPIINIYHTPSENKARIQYQHFNNAHTALKIYRPTILNVRKAKIYVKPVSREEFDNGIHIKNLPPTMTEERLVQMFSEYGEIKNVIFTPGENEAKIEYTRGVGGNNPVPAALRDFRNP
jgi:RNA recognition motif-containing protein